MTHPWNSLIHRLYEPHLLQTWEWGQVKQRLGWEPLFFTWEERDGVIQPAARWDGAVSAGKICAAAQILQRSVPVRGFAARLRVLYVSKGPLLLDWQDASLRRRVLADLMAIAKRQGAIFIKMDADVPVGTGLPGTEAEEQDLTGAACLRELQKAGWCFSHSQIQFRNTVQIDLGPDEETLLARMKQKTRYNVNLARRKGVIVRRGTRQDFPLLYQMYAETSVRDGFVIRNEAYYRSVWEAYYLPEGTAVAADQPVLEPLVAEVEGAPVAAVMVYRFGKKAWYIYGMSRDRDRDKMPNYLLQWEAMRRAKAAGCQVYDLWGAPDRFDESDSMWNVYRFKDGLGGTVVRHIGAWDFPARPFWYQVYTRAIPKVIGWMRRRGREQTRQQVQSEL